jgi:hypothetical protein
MAKAPANSPTLLLAHEHHTVANRQQHRFDARIAADFLVQGADRIGIGIVVIRIGDAARL